MNQYVFVVCWATHSQAPKMAEEALVWCLYLKAEVISKQGAIN